MKNKDAKGAKVVKHNASQLPKVRVENDVVPNELLIEIYKKSLKYGFSDDFILTLEKEIKKKEFINNFS